MKGEPVLIACEGSGCPVHLPENATPTLTIGICAMCGRTVQALGRDAFAVSHNRDDLLARIRRGDFG